MFGLLKLAAYSLLGYALYEFFRGVSGGMPSAIPSQTDAKPQRNYALPEAGEQVETTNADGGRSSYRVGRGVVSR